MSSSGSEGIRANYFGKSVTLVIAGNFGNPVMEQVQITLDHGIPLTPTQVSAARIEARFDTRNLPDLYLVGGSHLLSLYVGEQLYQVNVRVAAPEVAATLTPVIQSIEVIKDASDTPVALKISGLNFTQNVNFAQCKLNNEVVPILDSSLDQSTAILTVAIPDSEAFASQGQHSLS
ncbi:MAG: hypothetical protein CVV27_08360, partial [Candidatus Melainabacteria bacterium HGW-Melainabacteria-1]